MICSAKFLDLVRVAGWHGDSVPKVWHKEMREALSGDLIRVGFGGVIELTTAGREALAAFNK